jgi:hypothetical protein
MAVGVEAGALLDAGDLAAEIRNAVRGARIGSRREQPDDALLPMKVKLSANSHCRNAIASAISSTGSGGGLVLSSAAAALTRSSIGRQSCTANRTSPST